MRPVEIVRGSGPIVLGMPHGGTFVPGDIVERLNEVGQGLSDADWHIDRLYRDLLPDATVVAATFHRYVIDANRDPEGTSLYPGQNTTGLVPLTDFDGRPLWREGEEPDEAEIADRLARFHAPYHAALEAELARVRAEHGIAILYDCHSIRSVVPYLFEGTLPDLNIGTNGGTSCAPTIEHAVAEAGAASPCSHVVNGRFKGGWTTRHYGRPDEGRHAIQMEIAQSAYMTETPPWAYSRAKAETLRETLKTILEAVAREARRLTEETDR